MYVAIINVPGYSPESDPVEFDTAREAWEYLADERRHHEHAGYMGQDDEDYSDTLQNLERLATEPESGVGTVYGSTPGYDGDHDLGLAYSVTECSADDFRDSEGGVIHLAPGELTIDDLAEHHRRYTMRNDSN